MTVAPEAASTGTMHWPLVPRPPGEHPPEVVVAMAAARVNRMAIACADRLGTERADAFGDRRPELYASLA